MANRRMDSHWTAWLLLGAMAVWCLPVYGQEQDCPVNINFAAGDLSSWSAETGLLGGATKSYPTSNAGITIIPEYTISTTGIQIITVPSTDTYGGFSTIPTINGYAYHYAVKLGSTATSWDLHAADGRPGGFLRAITYQIAVPDGPADVPYTMTYAYAMVLENGTHNSNQQPLFKATLTTQNGVISCASPKYYLPTFNNAGGGPGGLTGATLDTVTARANGFSRSPVPFLSHTGRQNNTGTLLYDVWTKGWTEVTFDLSPYRGQTVKLSFEADNCIPGGHFAYAYVAVRNSCAGLEISGAPVACTGSLLTYSVPALAGADYQWTIPAGWTLQSGASGNTVQVVPGSTGGNIIVHEKNGCADLRDTLSTTTTLPTIAGKLNGEATVCAGENQIPMNLQGARGAVLNWLSSTDGRTWSTIDNTTDNYVAQDLATTTWYAAVVQNGAGCSIDTSAAVIQTVNARSAGGILSPPETEVCAGQSTGTRLTLSQNTGQVLNWQFSYDSSVWNDFSPLNDNSSYDVSAIRNTTYYRLLVKNGVCPTDTSTVAATSFVPVPFPQASIQPVAAAICSGDSVQLVLNVETGTSYSWTPTTGLENPGSGIIGAVPAVIAATLKPLAPTDYIFTISNAGCPNVLTDTVHVAVSAPIDVFAGNDTAIVVGQPLQLQAVVNTPSANAFQWTPAEGLNFADIPDPVARLNAGSDSITYVVTAADAAGCYGKDSVTVAVFKTGIDIFVPTAFTPNGDGVNDFLYPVCVGIRELVFFRVYDRWGQLVFHTNQIGLGWNGTKNGKAMPTGGFVYIVEGIDYNGKTVVKKGSSLLIR